MIKKLYKEPGKTTLQALQEYKVCENIKEKATFAGRLDPMAEGVFLALFGKDRYKKEKLNSLDKIYEIEVLLGANTDTGDILGILQGAGSCRNLSEKEILKALKNFKGGINWRYPCFSSKTFQGKQLFKYALEGDCPSERPKYKAEIYKIKLLGTYKIKKEDLQKEIFKKLSRLQRSSVKEDYADFRVRQIKNSWKEFLKECSANEFQILKLRVCSSKSVYMRTLAEKIGETLGCSAFALSIKRIAFGTSVQLFGKILIFLKKY